MSMEVRYYDEELGVENTAEGFLQEINYYNSPDDIPILQYIIETLKIDHQINSPIMQSPITENDIRKAQYHLDDIIEHRDYPNAEFYINSMKQDILSGLTRFESFYLDENTKLPITMVYDQNNPEKQELKADTIGVQICDYRNANEDNTYKENTFFISVTKFLDLTHSDFEKMLNDALVYANVYTYDTELTNDTHSDISEDEKSDDLTEESDIEKEYGE